MNTNNLTTVNATTFVLGGKEVKAKIQIKVSEKVSDTGKVSNVYASFSVPQSASNPITDINSAVARLCVVPSINVSIPQEKGNDVNLQLRPVMSGIRLAVLVCFLRQLDYAMLGITSDEVKEHLKACGLTDNVNVNVKSKSKSKSKSKAKASDDASDATGTRENILADATNNVPVG